MIPDISVIIPCYNSGKYLLEAIKSVTNYPGKVLCEIIIVNDGSSNSETLLLFNVLVKEGFNVIHQENKGPAAARNTGVKHASAEYLLFLDSDNRIRTSYIDKSIEILKNNEDVGVVYGNPSFFGDTTAPRFVSKAFDFNSLLLSNYIDMCAVIRKKVWKDINGFDEERILIGHEDWDFWIRASAFGWKFYYINETLFDYRITGDSVIINAHADQKLKNMIKYFYSKHLDLFIQNHRDLATQYYIYKEDQKRPFHSFLKFLFLKYR